MNKVLIKLYVPMLDNNYDVFIPVNEVIWKVNRLITKAITDLSDGALPLNKNYALINSKTGVIYNNNDIVINTDIRNSTKLVLIDI